MRRTSALYVIATSSKAVEGVYGAKSQALWSISQCFYIRNIARSFFGIITDSIGQLCAYVEAIDGSVKKPRQTWGPIDGAIARPTEEQQLYYLGYKGYYRVNYQSYGRN